MGRLISLTTDFGSGSAYVGVMKAVILNIAPDARLADLAHDVPAQDIRGGALALESAVPFFPPDTIHLAVVDPGVGNPATAELAPRKPIAVRCPTCVFVGPDNGLLWLAVQLQPSYQIVELTNPLCRLFPTSETFHGRDVFAPAAAHLARGMPFEELGPTLPDMRQLPLPQPAVAADGSLGLRVLAVDRFGNLITNLRASRYSSWSAAAGSRRVEVRIAGHRIDGIVRSYQEAAAGTLLAYFGSSDRLEIAVRDGSAARLTGAHADSEVLLRSTS